jgi:hypothetical protein
MPALSTVIGRGTLAARPAAANAGRIYYATDTDILYRDSGSAWQAISLGGGTANPGSPATNDRFFRTDLGLEIMYDGTRWLTTTLYQCALPFADALPPISATGTAHRVALPLLSTYTIRVIDYWAGFFVSGGTALSGSHKWVCDLKIAVTGTALGTININSGASSVWRQGTALAINTNVAITEFELEVLSTKTGTPGNLYLAPMFSYRLVIT